MDSSTTTSSGLDGHLKSTYPVYTPYHPALHFSDREFKEFIAAELTISDASPHVPESKENDDDFTMVDAESDHLTSTASTISKAGLNHTLDAVHLDDSEQHAAPPAETPTPAQGPFMNALLSHGTAEKKPRPLPPSDHMMRTANGDLAYTTTENALADLFADAANSASGPQMRQLLTSAWAEDPLMTLRLIFNVRSIHLGKSSRTTFYRAAGWLAVHHPQTLLVNLPWLTRPVIEKKKKKEPKPTTAEAADQDDDNDSSDDEARFDVRFGVSHGYWKDLLNLLVLSAHGALNCLANPSTILYVKPPKATAKKRKFTSKKDRIRKRDERKEKEAAVAVAADTAADAEESRHAAAIHALSTNPFHRALHMTVARLFAQQLAQDLAALRGSDARAKRTISLCGKWAPSSKRMHDRQTCIASTIAELLHPAHKFAALLPAEADPATNAAARTLYLRHAREAYRKDLAALRQHLDVVERHLSARALDQIAYARVPSTAMFRYAPVFIARDGARFDAYLDTVAAGGARISGATLTPAQLVHATRTHTATLTSPAATTQTSVRARLVVKQAATQLRAVDAQWRPLVQRLRDSGVLARSLAMADVSGSMMYPELADGTRPIDAAVGLALAVAEAGAAPFANVVVTFTSTPSVVAMDPAAPLDRKIAALLGNSGLSTDFVAAFRDCVLPLAVRNRVAPEDMVRRVFVFSDMEFDKCTRGGSHKWQTSYGAIRAEYAAAGYEIPELVFWNLAAGRPSVGDTLFPSLAPQNQAGYQLPKPVTNNDFGTCLVSGYSQAMLKVFLESGSFDEVEEEEEEAKEGKRKAAEKSQMTSLSIAKKAVSHKAYSMLQVVD